MPKKLSKFVVPICYSGLSNFIVEASTKDEALDLASEKFKNGETPEMLGNEYEDIGTIGEIERLPPEKKPTKTQWICLDCKHVAPKGDFLREVGCARCPECNSIEVQKLNPKGLCRVCFEPKDSCYAHCHNAKDGKHVPDLSTIQQANGAEGVIDVNCKVCGVSGSMRIDPKDIVFE
jgi:hypothetical protein